MYTYMCVYMNPSTVKSSPSFIPLLSDNCLPFLEYRILISILNKVKLLINNFHVL